MAVDTTLDHALGVRLFGTVVAVSRSPKHTTSKAAAPSIVVTAGLGVQGDVHAGATVQHSYSARRDPTRENLRQVHLLSREFLDELRGQGFEIEPGEMGENVTTRDLDLLVLPHGSRLRLGRDVVLELTGLRAPCTKLNRLRPGLMKACFTRGPAGKRSPKAGVMALVVASGAVAPGDPIEVMLPDPPFRALEPV